MSNIIMLDQLQTSDIKFVEGKQTGKSLTKILWVQDKQGKPVCLQLSTDFLKAPFGASTVFGEQEGESKRRVLDINVPREIQDKITEIETFVQERVREMKWVKKSATFTSILKISDGYDPKLRCRFNLGEIPITKVDDDEMKTVGTVEDITRGSAVMLRTNPTSSRS